MKKIIKNKSNIIAILILIVSITAFLSYNIFFREDTNSSYALSKYGSMEMWMEFMAHKHFLQ